MSYAREYAIKKREEYRAEYLRLRPLVKRTRIEELILLVLAYGFLIVGLRIDSRPLMILGIGTMILFIGWAWKGAGIRSDAIAALAQADILDGALKIADQIVIEERGAQKDGSTST
jgi:hypothetical protein